MKSFGGEMANKITFSKLTKFLYEIIPDLPDKRKGKNSTIELSDIFLSAFSVFYTQSPSFLHYQKTMQESKGLNNATSLFGIKKIPSDNHIRTILDPIDPGVLYPIFGKVFSLLDNRKIINEFRTIDNSLLIPLDGTWYFSSDKLSCKNCLTKKSKEGTVTYYHSAITPVIVSPDKNDVISLAPEMIIPQDGAKKQDCEINAGKRWIEKYGDFWNKQKSIILGDDLYSKEPFCMKVLEKGLHFIFVCKPDSHKYMYSWLNDLEENKDYFVLKKKVWTGKRQEVHSYKWANNIPIKEGGNVLDVNWCQIEIKKEDGRTVYKNAFITKIEITAENVALIVKCGRSRWKIENENNNTLKTKGYNLDHNFGHGSEYLSSVLLTLNLLSFLFHTILSMECEKYQYLKKILPGRKTFFQDIRALTRYIYFTSWEQILEFMIQGLEKKIEPG